MVLTVVVAVVVTLKASVKLRATGGTKLPLTTLLLAVVVAVMAKGLAVTAAMCHRTLSW